MDKYVGVNQLGGLGCQPLPLEQVSPAPGGRRAAALSWGWASSPAPPTPRRHPPAPSPLHHCGNPPPLPFCPAEASTVRSAETGPTRRRDPQSCIDYQIYFLNQKMF